MLYSYSELMNLHVREDMDIYKKINEYVNGAIVLPFDADILSYLNTHRDAANREIEANYLDSLNSSYSIGKCFRFSRYLALSMEGQSFKLCEGSLNAFNNGDFPHSWIEKGDYVYDVTFMGVWPKDVYYKLFMPSIEKVIDLNTDEAYQEYKKNTVESEKKKAKPFLKYRDWYSYYYSLMVPFIPAGVSTDINAFYFPCDKEEASIYEFVEGIKDYWYNTCNEKRVLPTEVLENALLEFIRGEHYIKPTSDLYREYLIFISTNYTLYEDNKHNCQDLTLWKASIAQKHSGSFCQFISDLPKVLAHIDENKKGLA